MSNLLKYKFCPICGRPLKKKSIEHKQRLICGACDFVFYQNSKPCVAAIIMRGKEILLTKRAIAPFKGYWDTPGGFLEEGEAPEVGMKRELMEELGLRCRIASLFGIFMDTYGKSGDHILNLYYIVEALGSPKHAVDDIDDYAFFPLTKLPKKLAFHSARVVLKRLSTER